jgi:hypothetical protein
LRKKLFFEKGGIMKMDIQYLLGKKIMYKYRPITNCYPFRMKGPVFEYGPEEEKMGVVVGWWIRDNESFHLIISFENGIENIESCKVRLVEENV